MLDNINSYICLDCGKIAGPYSKRKMNTMDGKLCDKCHGKLIPAYVGIDMAREVDRSVEQGGLSPAI
jgi:DNA-directed RNA polymerase subunit RPC12/RpoP